MLLLPALPDDLAKRGIHQAIHLTYICLSNNITRD